MQFHFFIFVTKTVEKLQKASQLKSHDLIMGKNAIQTFFFHFLEKLHQHCIVTLKTNILFHFIGKQKSPQFFSVFVYFYIFKKNYALINFLSTTKMFAMSCRLYLASMGLIYLRFVVLLSMGNFSPGLLMSRLFLNIQIDFIGCINF